MKATRFNFALALLLAAHTTAEADPRTVGFWASDQANEFDAEDVRPNLGGYYAAVLEPADERAILTAIAVTILLTIQGQLVRLPGVKPMNSMAECRAWTRQQEFMRVLPGYLATFHYCDYAPEL